MKRRNATPSAIRTLPDEQLATITGGGNVKGANVEHLAIRYRNFSAPPTGIGRANLLAQIQ